MVKKSATLESFVAYVYSNLLKFSECNSVISRNILIKGLSGIVHEFDVYYEFPHLNLTFKVAIECKDWNRPIDKGKVQEFWAKIDDISNIAGVMIAKSSYQKGALEYAKTKGILLLTLDDLPTLTQIVAKKLKFLFLPDENTIGTPFWTIMEFKSGSTTGTYLNIGDKNNPAIPLFYSKKIAEVFLDGMANKNSWCVRGLTQAQLNAQINIAKNITNTKFAICFIPVLVDEKYQFIYLDYKTINELYLLS